MSEESKEIKGSAPYKWIVDPIDGTRNYAYGIPHFCVCIALAQGEEGGGLLLRAQLLSPDGGCSVEGSARGDDPVELGARLAGELLAGAPPVIRDLFG